MELDLWTPVSYTNRHFIIDWQIASQIISTDF
jgi:hypothetical protein